MLAQRYQIVVLLGLVAILSSYLLLPLGASYLLANRLRDHGYSHVILQLGYPGWTHMRIPVVSFQQDLGKERLVVSLTDAEIRYDLTQLLQGHVGRIVLRDAAIHMLNVQPIESTEQEGRDTDQPEEGESPWRL